VTPPTDTDTAADGSAAMSSTTAETPGPSGSSQPAAPVGTARPPIAVSVRGVQVSFTQNNVTNQVLENIDLEIPQGEFVSLIGPSGCGKTTLLRVVAGLVTPQSGVVEVNGEPVRQALRDGSIAYAFQSSALLEWRTALANVMLPLQLAGVRRKEARERAMSLLARAGLEKHAGHYPRQLSGGMQQRVSIARSLARSPSTILMDEPFAALDEITRGRMNEWLLDICSSTSAAVLFVTHNIREATVLSDRIVVLAPNPGRLQSELRVDLPRPRTDELWETDRFYDLRRRGEELLARAVLEAEDED
jgi:NitT/TauT family transport system ATP-binding protein